MVWWKKHPRIGQYEQPLSEYYNDKGRQCLDAWMATNEMQVHIVGYGFTDNMWMYHVLVCYHEKNVNYKTKQLVSYTIRRSLKDFYDLYQWALTSSQQCHHLPAFPRGNFFFREKEESIAKKSVSLRFLLQQIMSIPELQYSTQVRDFIGSPPSDPYGYSSLQKYATAGMTTEMRVIRMRKSM